MTIAEKIQQRRLQMLVHSYIYYRLDTSIVSDYQWSKWGRELKDLQEDYPSIADSVIYAEAFKDWDASSGAYLPLDDPWIEQRAQYLLKLQENDNGKTNTILQQPTGEVSRKVTKGKTSRKQRGNALF